VWNEEVPLNVGRSRGRNVTQDNEMRGKRFLREVKETERNEMKEKRNVTELKVTKRNRTKPNLTQPNLTKCNGAI